MGNQSRVLRKDGNRIGITQFIHSIEGADVEGEREPCKKERNSQLQSRLVCWVSDFLTRSASASHCFC